jgi:Sec-independent protein translocase protein TatA
VGFGTELLFIIALGLLVLGPKRLHTTLRHVARAKAQFEKASNGFKSQLEMELGAAVRDDKAYRLRQPVEEQRLAADHPNRNVEPAD